jgi:hypothetical protein
MLMNKSVIKTSYRQTHCGRTSSHHIADLTKNKPSGPLLVGVVVAAFGFSSLLQGLDGENDNLTATNFRSVHAEEDHPPASSMPPKKMMIACAISDPPPSVSIVDQRAVNDLKTFLFPGSAIVSAALSIADSAECLTTVPPPVPSFPHCVHTEAESLIDQKDYSCTAENMLDHRFIVRFGRYLSNSDFLE